MRGSGQVTVGAKKAPAVHGASSSAPRKMMIVVVRKEGKTDGDPRQTFPGRVEEYWDSSNGVT